MAVKDDLDEVIETNINSIVVCQYCGRRTRTQENGIILPHSFIRGSEVACQGSPKLKRLKIAGRRVKVVELDSPSYTISQDCMWTMDGVRWHKTNAPGDRVADHMIRRYVKVIEFFDKSLEEFDS